MVQYLHFRFLIFSLIMWMCQVKTGYRKKEMLGSEHDQNMTNTKDGYGFWHFRLIGPANIKIDLTTPMFAPRELHLQHLHSDTWANVWFTLLYSTIISDYTLWINVNHWVVPLTHLEKHHDVSFFTSTNSIKFPHRGHEIGQIISNLFFFRSKPIICRHGDHSLALLDSKIGYSKLSNVVSLESHSLFWPNPWISSEYPPVLYPITSRWLVLKTHSFAGWIKSNTSERCAQPSHIVGYIPHKMAAMISPFGEIPMFDAWISNVS